MEPKILDIRYKPINLFSISNFKKEFDYLREFLLMINSTWRDIQKLNSFCHCIIGRISEEDNITFECMFDGLEVITKDFYIHFSIIYKLLEKISNECKNNDIKGFFNNFDKSLGHNTQILRNEVIIHKEKSDFRKTMLSMFDTSYGGLFIKLHTEKGDFELKPFVDSRIVEDQLLTFKKIIEK